MKIIVWASAVAVFLAFQNCSGNGVSQGVSFQTDSLSLEDGSVIACESEADVSARTSDYICLFPQESYQGKACCLARGAPGSLYRVPPSNPLSTMTASVRVRGNFAFTACTEYFASRAQYDACMPADTQSSSPPECPAISCSSFPAGMETPHWVRSDDVYMGFRSLIY